jgi:hypothetical protein
MVSPDAPLSLCAAAGILRTNPSAMVRTKPQVFRTSRKRANSRLRNLKPKFVPGIRILEPHASIRHITSVKFITSICLIGKAVSVLVTFLHIFKERNI